MSGTTSPAVGVGDRPPSTVLMKVPSGKMSFKVGVPGLSVHAYVHTHTSQGVWRAELWITLRLLTTQEELLHLALSRHSINGKVTPL